MEANPIDVNTEEKRPKCTYYQCTEPAIYTWLDDMKDIIVCRTCIEHSKLLIALYNKKHVSKDDAGEYSAACMLARHGMKNEKTK
jgi:hypothetical protein